MKPSEKFVAIKCPTPKKHKFQTKEKAQAALCTLVNKKRKSKRTKIVTHLKAYYCCCGLWHYGNSKDIDWDLIK